MTGAARLAALAAARMGTGMTSIAVPEMAFACYASQLLSIIVHPYANAEALLSLFQSPRINAYLAGPGAGVNALTLQVVTALLATAKPVVLDADALTVLADQSAYGLTDETPDNIAENALQRLARLIHGPCVLTPHAGEFARLTGTTVAESLEQRIAQARACAHDCHAVVVLKGADTVIACPEGRVMLNLAAPATLATAGAGDVLAGMIAGLLAQGMAAYDAAAAAVWIHSEAARLFGPGLIAEDVPRLIPDVLAHLLAQTEDNED